MAALIIDKGGHLHGDSIGLSARDAERGMTYGFGTEMTGKAAQDGVTTPSLPLRPCRIPPVFPLTGYP